MDLYDQNLIPRIIFTVISVVLTIGPTIADFNKTHATHPDWTGHARFHVAVSYTHLTLPTTYSV